MHLRDQLLGQARFFETADPPKGGGEPAAAAPAEPLVVAPALAPVVPEPAPVVKPEPAVVAPASDWRDKRIAELTAKLNAERAKPATAPEPVPGESAEVFQARVDEAANLKAAEIAAVNEWNSRCNSVNEQGIKEFPDFSDRLKACQSVANLADPAEFSQFNAIISAAMETGQAHKLIHQLGESPGEVKRLMGLAPMKMAMEMATRAAKIGAGPIAPEPSGAPKPITPVGSKGNHYDGLDPRTVNGSKLPIGEWMRQREKQAADAGIQ